MILDTKEMRRPAIIIDGKWVSYLTAKVDVFWPDPNREWWDQPNPPTSVVTVDGIPYNFHHWYIDHHARFNRQFIHFFVNNEWKEPEPR